MRSAKTAIAVAFAVSLVTACEKSETTTTNSSTTSESTATSSTVSETATALPVTDSSSTVTSTAPPATTTTPAVVATTSRTPREPSKTKETKPSASPARTETAATTATVPPPPPPPASAPSPRQETPPAAPPDPTVSSAEGASIFKKSGCTVCHGADASGNTPMGKKNNIPDFHSAAVQSQSDAELSRLIAEGKGPVSAGAHKSKHLTPDQVKALVAFIRTLK